VVPTAVPVMSWFWLYAKQLSGERWFQMGSPVSDFRWLLLTGIVVGLLTRKIISGKAYGTVADMLLGITGAFASAWMTEALVSYRTIAWENRLLFAIWGAAALPALAHFLAKRHPSANPYHARTVNRNSAKP
jgi:uncharacterized membrane protein YeaQ/YmgE (transglycosylase-associated protein family)